jgi:hypothetical protein
MEAGVAGMRLKVFDLEENDFLGGPVFGNC